MIVECLTDNKNRTAGEVRAAFAKHGGNLGETNSVSNSPGSSVGEIRYPLAAASEDAMLEAAIEAGCDDCVVEDEHHVITCEMNALAAASRRRWRRNSATPPAPNSSGAPTSPFRSKARRPKR